MGSYIIKVTNGSDVGTIENQVDIGFDYSDLLNQINTAEIKISGLGSIKRGLIDINAQVEIFRNGTLEFKGLIDNIDSLDGGGQSIHVTGFELRLVQEKGSYSNSPYSSTASATIAGDIIGESSYFSAGTINTGVNLDFRIDKAQSLWNALGNLSTKTGQDIQIDYVNDEVDILDNRGSLTSVAALNDGIDIKNIRYSRSYPKSNSVKVYGKGDGVNQIESDDAQGQDATSKATYGTIKEVIIDRSIISISEANSRANIEVAKLKDEMKIYDFEVMNFESNITTGDVITINSLDKSLVNESVRVVGIQRGIINNTEFMSLQVTNSAYSQLIKTANQVLGSIQKESVDVNTYMQGSGNTLTWPRGLNAKSGTPLSLIFEIPAEYIEDEAGNLRVNSFTVDYDVDPYKKGVGGATDSGHQHNDPLQTSSNYTLGSEFANDTFQENIISGWDLIDSQTADGTFDYIFIEIEAEEDSWSGTDDISFRIDVGGVRKVTDGIMVYNTSLGPFRKTYVIPIFQSINATVNVFMYSSGAQDYQGEVRYSSKNDVHNHTVSAHNVDSGTASVSIGDDVSDAGSINATEVDIYLDYWNGSAWVNKHSVLNTGKTLDSNVDISDSGTYPDNSGFWRIRIDPDSGSADYVQAVAKIRHLLDNKE